MAANATQKGREAVEAGYAQVCEVDFRMGITRIGDELCVVAMTRDAVAPFVESHPEDNRV